MKNLFQAQRKDAARHAAWAGAALLLIAIVAVPWTWETAPSPAVAVDGKACPPVIYERKMQGAVRTYDFDATRPFVSPRTGKPDVQYMDFDGKGLSGDAIINAGSQTPHIGKVLDASTGQPAIRIQVFPEDHQRFGYRTQLNSYGIEPYKHYVYELNFRLDETWDFDMPEGAGVLWQVKGHARPNQYGHPAMALGLVRRELRFAVLYPRTAEQASDWPSDVAWGKNDYVNVTFPTRTIESNRYYQVRIAFYADDRPARHGSQGYARVSLDGRPWIDYTGPTLHPDQLAQHRIDFGWYQWEGRPRSTRTVYFRHAHLYEERPCT